jgi:hypothetical protein
VKLDELARLRPSEGARFLLELEHTGDDGKTARYRAWIFVPTMAWGYRVEVSVAADPVVTADGQTAPEELERALTMQARLVTRSAPGRAEEGQPAWPPRILRWRGPGRGT